jgi:membrane peptidoglycan carboxypeptidase
VTGPASDRPARERLTGLAPAGARPVAARWRRVRAWLLGVPGLLLLLAAAGGSAYLWLTTPAGDDLPARVAAVASATSTVALRPAEAPKVLAQAVVAVEDERFYVHHGLDTVGTTRAVWDDLTGWCACEGGSTVTQQLAKLVYYPDDGRISRKLPGMAVAFKLEIHYDKAQIMAAYLSVVPMGYGLTGAREAACAYFGHSLAQVTIAEAAELAGTVQAPSAYDPRYHPEVAKARRDYALERMAQVGSITEQQALAGMLAPVAAGQGHC